MLEIICQGLVIFGLIILLLALECRLHNDVKKSNEEYFQKLENAIRSGVYIGLKSYHTYCIYEKKNRERG